MRLKKEKEEAECRKQKENEPIELDPNEEKRKIVEKLLKMEAKMKRMGVSV